MQTSLTVVIKKKDSPFFTIGFPYVTNCAPKDFFGLSKHVSEVMQGNMG